VSLRVRVLSPVLAARGTPRHARAMLKRLGIGWLKGLIVGGAIGAGLHFGLGWASLEPLLAYLVSMATVASAAVLAGRAPWREGAWIEALLKGVAGVGFGALLAWLSSRFAGFALPFALPGVDVAAKWSSVPLVFAPLFGALTGALVELDNTGEDAKASGVRGGAPRVRAPVDEAEDAEIEEPAPPRRRGA
jgi:hypothetical protein